jgi:hypothetical protein
MLYGLINVSLNFSLWIETIVKHKLRMLQPLIKLFKADVIKLGVPLIYYMELPEG